MCCATSTTAPSSGSSRSRCSSSWSRCSSPGSEAERLLVEAQEQLTASLAELREFAHGLHPSLLTTHGLATALASLAGRAPVPSR
jgi:signal transduction histidine kinase